MKLNVAGLFWMTMIMVWNVVSVVWTGVMFLGAAVLVVALVVGGIGAWVWMYQHDGPAKFFTNLLVMAVTFALLKRGLELLGRADSTKGQAGS